MTWRKPLKMPKNATGTPAALSRCMSNTRLARIASRSQKNLMTDVAWLVGSAFTALGIVIATSMLA